MKHFYVLVFFVFVAVYFPALAQKGPGGVSHESVDMGGIQDNIVWLDAGSFTVSDGGLVSLWTDEAPEAVDNSPYQSTPSLQPIVRKDISATINGKAVLQFGDGRKLLFVSQNNFNNKSVENRTSFMVFRTGADINTLQVIYEEGGNVRGLNVYIYEGELYFGGYDNAVDADGVPKWSDVYYTPIDNKGFSFTKVPIEPYTTYVVSHIFHGEPTTDLSTGYITGFLNGSFIGDSARRVGALYAHPDNPGLGAVNGQTIVHLEILDVSSQQYASFLGDYAEFVVYDKLLTDAERIIVENYLGAKYFANSLGNDFFEYKAEYGYDVIGIGQANDGSRHRISQGKNPFEMRASSTQFQNSEFLFCGHDNGPLDSYTSVGAPGKNTIRLKRTWRFDATGNLGTVTFNLDPLKIPAPPEPDFSKYLLIVDKSGGNLPNFNSAQTEVIEMSLQSGMYVASTAIPDGAFVTFGLAIPSVYFALTEDFGFEGDVDVPGSAVVELNYTPGSTVRVDLEYSTALAEALNPDDFKNVLPAIVSFPAGNRQQTVSFTLTGDDVEENTERFELKLADNGNLTTGVQIGGDSVLTFNIFDDDHEPEIRFPVTALNVVEQNGEHIVYLDVVRLGETAPEVSADFVLRAAGTTATNGVDFAFTPGKVIFASGETAKQIPLTVKGDLLFEGNETVVILLRNPVGAKLTTATNKAFVSLTNDDPVPEVEFYAPSAGNPEIIGDPMIQVVIQSPSSYDILVSYAVDEMASTAINGLDYTLALTGTVVIPAGATSAFIPMITTNDVENNEPDETVVVNLTGTDANSALKGGGNLQHVFTIKDYVSFEWTGTAGVGTKTDNIFWYTGDAQSNNTRVDDSSPNNADASRTNGGGYTKVNNALAGHAVMRFDGTSDYTVADNTRINSGSEYVAKDIFLVLTTPATFDANGRILFEQGSSTNGLNIYLMNDKLYFNGYSNYISGDIQYRWGVSYNSSQPAFVSATLSPSTTYFVTCRYRASGAEKGLHMFVDGQLAGSYANVDTLRGDNNDIGIGGKQGNTRLHTNATGTSRFIGDLAEMIYYNDPDLNVTRRKVVENYLAAKYRLVFADVADQLFDYEATHNYEVVGIGGAGTGDFHLDSQGPGRVRVRKPSDASEGEYLFLGHNNGVLTNSNNVPVDFSYRMTRTWKVDKSGGDVGKLILSIDASTFSNGDGYDIELLIDDDGDFSNARRHSTGREYDPAYEIITFSDVTLNDGEYFTLGLTINYWSGTISTNWSNPDNWRGRLPLPGNTVAIPANPPSGNYPETMTDAAFTIRNLIVEPGAFVRVPKNKTLNITGNLTLKTPQNSGPIGELIDDGTLTVSGTTTVERFVPKNEWHYLSSPIQDAQSSMFTKAMGWNPNFLAYNEAYNGPGTTNTDDYEDAWVYAHNGKEGLPIALTPGKGYANYINGWYQYNFKGALNSTDQTVTVTYTANDNATVDGWNLVGNPFPCSIDWNKIASTDRQFVFNTIYFWNEDHVTGHRYYSYYNGINSPPGSETEIPGVRINNGSNIIPPCQGFFVHARSTAGAGGRALRFKRTIRVHGTNLLFKSATAGQNPDMIRLHAQSGGHSDETLVRFLEFTADTFDGDFDVYKMYSNVDEMLQLFTLSAEGIELVLNTLSPVFDTLSLPLGMSAGTAGHAVLSLTEMQLPENMLVELIDHEADTLIDLTQSGSYALDFVAGVNTDRLELRFSYKVQEEDEEDDDEEETPNRVVPVSSSDYRIWASSGVLHAEVDASVSQAWLAVYDLSGKLLLEKQVYAGLNSLPVNLPSAVYAVEIRAGVGLHTQRVFVP